MTAAPATRAQDVITNLERRLEMNEHKTFGVALAAAAALMFSAISITTQAEEAKLKMRRCELVQGAVGLHER